MQQLKFLYLQIILIGQSSLFLKTNSATKLAMSAQKYFFEAEISPEAFLFLCVLQCNNLRCRSVQKFPHLTDPGIPLPDPILSARSRFRFFLCDVFFSFIIAAAVEVGHFDA